MQTILRYTATLCLLCACSLTTVAQVTAQQALDRAAATLSTSKAIVVGFTADTYRANKRLGGVQGSMTQQGKRFFINTPGYKTWFDGKTQWTYLKSNEEVNVNNPTQDELQAINPYAFLNLYKTGYTTTISSTQLRGKACYEVRLVAQHTQQPFKEILLTLEQKNYTPLCVRFRQDQTTWTRISIDNITYRNSVKSSLFQFPQASFPQAEVIDLR